MLSSLFFASSKCFSKGQFIDFPFNRNLTNFYLFSYQLFLDFPLNESYTVYCSLHVYKFGFLIYIILDSIFKYVLRLKLLKFACSVQQMSFKLYNSKRKSVENCFVTEICSISWFP